jgi:hypothetical protein
MIRMHRNPVRNFDYPMPYQGKMAKSALAQISRDADALRGRLQDGDLIPQWVHYKIAVAAHDISTVRNYLQYELDQRSGAKAKINPAGDTEASRLAQAIARATPKLALDLKSRDPVVHSAATQLQALLLSQPANASTFIKLMRANLAKTDTSTVGPKHTVLVKVYERMDKLWTAAQVPATR